MAHKQLYASVVLVKVLWIEHQVQIWGSIIARCYLYLENFFILHSVESVVNWTSRYFPHFKWTFGSEKALYYLYLENLFMHWNISLRYLQSLVSKDIIQVVRQTNKYISKQASKCLSNTNHISCLHIFSLELNLKQLFPCFDLLILTLSWNRIIPKHNV